MIAFVANIFGGLTRFFAPFASVLLGGLITFIASYFFYYRASRQLKEETQKLLKPIRLVLEALEAGNVVEFTKDDKTGEPVSITLKINVQEKIQVANGRGCTVS